MTNKENKLLTKFLNESTKMDIEEAYFKSEGFINLKDNIKKFMIENNHYNNDKKLIEFNATKYAYIISGTKYFKEADNSIKNSLLQMKNDLNKK
jgi:hypothetical protein